MKLYLPEPASADVNRILAGRDDVLVSDLAVTELVSALARRSRHGEISRDLARRVQQSIVAALERGLFQRVDLTREVHRRAEHFLLGAGGAPLRAGDALHLALATSARAASLASFDARLAAAARAAGLVVYPA